ncbi:MAG: exodeoxyribonuclease III [Alphaproteobacteria bacterium]
MKISSWNVNSVNARMEHVKKYLAEYQPDILMVQELKTQDFPEAEFKDTGYTCKAVGQKSYNGVAIFSRHDIKVIHTNLPGNDNDDQARYIEADIKGLRFINIYLPNGNPVGTEKFNYKLGWMSHLKARLADLRREQRPFAIGGDFNVIPENKDCHDPKVWEGDALFRPESRALFRTMVNLGLTDALRVFNQKGEQYTFWDYQAGAWPQNKGIRIDHFLLSPELADRLEACEIHKEPRGWDKPSDHTPIQITLACD